MEKEREGDMSDEKLDPDRKGTSPSFSDLIVVDQGEKYAVLPPDPNRDQEKLVVPDAAAGANGRRIFTAKRVIIALIVVLIALVAVFGAVASTVWRKNRADPPKPTATVDSNPASANTHTMSGTATATYGYLYPTAVSPEPTTIHVLSVGGNSSLYVKKRNTSDPGGWASSSDWTSLGGIISPGLVTAVSRGPGSVDVFCRGNNNDLFHKYLANNTWGPTPYDWEDRNGVLQNAPEVVSWGNNKLDVFAIADGNGLSTLSLNVSSVGNQTGNFSIDNTFAPAPWIPLGGNWSKQIMPTLVSWAKGRLDVFLVHPKSGELYHRFLDPNVTNWQPFYGFESLGGKLAGRPGALSLSEGRIDLFARGGDAGLWTMRFANGQWSNWSWLGENIRGEPAVVSCAKNRIDVFVWTEDFKYVYKSFDGTKWIPDVGFNSLGDTLFGGPPKVLSRAEGVIDLFGYSNHGSVMHKAWNRTLGGWAPTVPFDDLGMSH